MPHVSRGQLAIPESLERKILDFRRRVWTIKLVEAVAGGVIGLFVGYLLTYAADRFHDTPRSVRWGIFAAALATCVLIPLAIDKWVWRRRRLDQLARLLSHKHPSVGDQLLGIIELAGSASEQERSPALVEAAIRQVSAEAERRDFKDAVPDPKHRRRSWTATGLATLAVGLLILTTAAATNAWSRFLAPWKDIPRYTFASIEPLPDRMYVPHGEPFTLPVRLSPGTEWKPGRAEARVARQAPVQAPLEEAGYNLDLPAQMTPGALQLSVGDYSGRLTVEPVHRPELSSLSAQVQLPEYLGRPAPQSRDIRGGAVSVVKGSRAAFTATASRELAAATVDGRPRAPQGKQFASDVVAVEESRDLTLEWRDSYGLSGQKPFVLTVNAIDDEAPSLTCENLPRQKVLLDSEVLTFQVRAGDDFGVKRVGIEWEGLDQSLPRPAKGEKIIGAGGTEAEMLNLAATFGAVPMGIDPQPIAVRVFVEDYLPGRERVYSPTCVYDVLNADDHAVWVMSMLSRWLRMSLDVRDRELQLHEVNKELRSLPAEELDQPDVRRRVEAQASAERANARRLTNLVSSGESLLKEAMRNPEIGVGHLEKWAEMMQILKDIAGNRMPSVADLLKEAAASPPVAQNSRGNNAPKAGQVRANLAGGAPKKGGELKPPTEIPTITDIESTMNQPKPGEPKPPSESKGSQPRLTLPTTMLAGNGQAPPKPPAPPSQQVEEAVKQQQDLLAEFEKIADELNTVLANLEGTTLVKRLKASSRKQHQVADKLGALVTAAFGVDDRAKAAQSATFRDLAEAEAKGSQDVSNIMDDMAAYFDRSRFMRFKVVLDDMRKQDVTAGLRTLGDDLKKENGLSISQAEYWSDTLDRWAEDLVEVTKCGACPGCKSKGSLPPSIVLEVLQVLEAEMNLREETRVAEQARRAVEATEHAATGKKLSETQDALNVRIDKVIVRIQELPDAEEDFGKELALLAQVSEVMQETTGILATPETGAPAIAAETEIIELLLQSKRFNPCGGGGGGSNPGGGGGGTTTDSALALVGSGLNEKEVREDRGTTQATGNNGVVLPEEFRAGLDEYFNRLDEPGR